MKKILIALIALPLLASPALAQNYTATAGAGLTFGAALTGGVLYPKQTVCDTTTPSQCLVVNASGQFTFSNTSIIAAGPNAGGAAATGNPVAIGGVYRSTLPTYTDGLRSELQTGTRGSLNIQVMAPDSVTPIAAPTPADGLATGVSLRTWSQGAVWNGATWDRAPGNTSGSIMQGAVAGGVAAAGNPVAIGGSYNSTLPTYTTGQRGELQQGTRGALHIQIQTPDSATPVAGSSFADGASNTGTGLRSWSGNNVFNGTTWDRMPGTTAGVLVNPGTLTSWGILGIGSTTAGSNAGLVMGAVTTAAPTYTTAQNHPLSLDTTGALRVNVTAGGAGGGAVTMASGAVASGAYASGSIASGAMVDLGAIADAAATAGSTGSVNAKLRTITAQLDTLNTTATTAIPTGTNTIGAVYPEARATGGASTTGNIGANNTTAVVVKASAGTLYGAQLANIGSVPLYLKIYNATSATCGSGTPVKRLIIPKAGTAADGGGSNIDFGPAGVAFSTGITYCLTAAIGDSDTTAPAASVALVNLDWK